MESYNFDYFANVPKNKTVYTKVDQMFKDGCYNPQSAHFLGSIAYSHMNSAFNNMKLRFPMYEQIEFIPGGGSSANMRAFFGQNKIKHHVRSQEHDIVMISSIEHSSITKYGVRQLLDRGYTIVTIPVTTTGIINIVEFEKLLVEYSNRTVMVSCMLINNETGIIQPIVKMINVTKKINSNIIFHSDVGCGIHMIKTFDVIPDIITCSCYKFGGPHYGLLMATSNMGLRKEYYGTPDVYNICAVTFAVCDYLDSFDLNDTNNAIFKLVLQNVFNEKFRVNNITFIPLNTEITVSNIFSFILPCLKASYIQQQLSKVGFAIGSGSACTTNEGSHTLKVMGYDANISQRLIRLSFSLDDLKIKTHEEYINIAETLADLIISTINSASFLIGKTYDVSPKICCKPIIIYPLTGLQPTIDENMMDIEMTNPYINSIKITYGELNLKGQNKQHFIDRLKSDIIYRLKECVIGHDITFKLNQMRGFSIIHFSVKFDVDNQILKDIIFKLTKIAGLHMAIPMEQIDDPTIENINSAVAGMYDMERNLFPDSEKTFKIRANISNKTFLGKTSKEWEYYIGKYIKDKFNDSVNLNFANVTTDVFHDGSHMYVSSQKYYGFGGLPTGSDLEGTILFVIKQSNYHRSIYSMVLMVKRGCTPIVITDNESIKNYCDIFGRSICTKYSSKYCSVDELDNPKSLYPNVNHIVIEPSDMTSKNFTEIMKTLKQYGNTHDIHAFCNTMLISQEKTIDSLETFGSITNHTDSKGLLLISGGIDSPVVSAKLLENNIQHDYIHFIGDFNDEVSKTKIINIVSKINKTNVHKPTIHFVQFGELQKLIAKDFKEDYRVMLYKIFMVKIANDLCQQHGYDFISMGNSWGQVASQTAKNIFVTDHFSTVPIFSPLLGENKENIIDNAKKFGTFDYSICDGNDCCVMFLPKNPVLKASVKYINFVINKIGEYDSIIKIFSI